MGHRVTTLNVNTIEPAGSTLTLGASGDTIVATDSVNVNTVKDAGGNTLWVSNGSGILSSVSSGFGDALKLISSQTASGAASVSFTSGIDSTYKEYIFKCYELNPVDNAVDFSFQCSTDGGSNYNMTMTTTFFRAWHYANDSDSGLAYQTARDQAQGTAFQPLAFSSGNQAKGCMVGELHLFNPGSTTYVKNFFTKTNLISANGSPYQLISYVAGYVNSTSDIDAVQFKFSSGNINAGIIMMYGVK